MFSDFDADPLLIHPSLNHGMGIVAAAQILKEKSVALDPLADFLIVFCKIVWLRYFKASDRFFWLCIISTACFNENVA